MNEKILKLLEDKRANLKCARCSHDHLTLYNSIINHPISSSLDKKMKINYIPAVLLVCNNCGYMMYHALGLLEDEE